MNMNSENLEIFSIAGNMIYAGRASACEMLECLSVLKRHHEDMLGIKK